MSAVLLPMAAAQLRERLGAAAAELRRALRAIAASAESVATGLRRRRAMANHIAWLSGELQAHRRRETALKVEVFDVLAEADQALARGRKLQGPQRDAARRRIAVLQTRLMPATLRPAREEAGHV